MPIRDPLATPVSDNSGVNIGTTQSFNGQMAHSSVGREPRPPQKRKISSQIARHQSHDSNSVRTLNQQNSENTIGRENTIETALPIENTNPNGLGPSTQGRSIFQSMSRREDEVEDAVAKVYGVDKGEEKKFSPTCMSDSWPSGKK